MSMTSTKLPNNFADNLIAFMLGILAFGNLGGSMTPLRMVALPMLAVGFVHSAKQPRSRFLAELHFFLFLFCSWMIFSVVWTLDYSEATKEILYFFVHSSLFLALVYLSGIAANPIRSICTGWVIAVAATAPVALVELIFDWHLPMSLQVSDTLINYGDGNISAKMFASVTFGNWNTYVVFLCFALPFLIGFVRLSQSNSRSLLGILLVLFVGAVVLINASRGGLVAFLIVAFISAYQYLRSTAERKLRTSALLAFVVCFGVWFGYDFLSFQILSKLGAIGFVEDSYRETLWLNGIELILDSKLLGVGVGSLMAAYERLGADILLPHNMFLEIFIQYGLIMFAFFLYLLLRVGGFGLSTKDSSAKFVVLSSLVSLPVVGIINSGYWLSPVVWCYLASVFMIGFHARFRARTEYASGRGL